MENELKVGIGDMKMTMGTGVIATYALGSCIGVSFYDPKIKLGALVHVLLPERLNQTDPNLYKYANTGVEETIRRLKAFGMKTARTEVKIAGGANMFTMPGATIADIGARNIDMVRKIVTDNGFQIKAEDVGKDYARTMRLDIKTGDVTVTTFGKPIVVM